VWKVANSFERVESVVFEETQSGKEVIYPNEHEVCGGLRADSYIRPLRVGGCLGRFRERHEGFETSGTFLKDSSNQTLRWTTIRKARVPFFQGISTSTLSEAGAMVAFDNDDTPPHLFSYS